MAYIRYKVTEELHKTIKSICKRIGLKESEISRTAVIEYLKTLGAFDKK